MSVPFDADVRRLAQGSVLCWLATADAAGAPTVSPKEIWQLHGGDQVLVAHIASARSVANLARQPRACVAFVDVLVQKGYKLHGVCEVVSPGHAEFAALHDVLAPQCGGKFVIRAVLRLRVTRSERILAPSYVFHPGTQEEDQVRSARRRYLDGRDA